MRRVSEISTLKHFQELARFLRLTVEAGAVSAPPGMGKTTAAQALADADKKTIYVHVGATKNTPRAFASSLADALNIWTKSESTARIWSVIESHLSHYSAQELLLIFDEAQNIPLALLKEVVDFPSRFRVPVLVTGNSELLKRQRVSSAAFDQISSRIAKRVVLTSPTEDDFQIIAVDFDVFGKDAHAACVNFGRNNRCASWCRCLIRPAFTLAKGLCACKKSSRPSSGTRAAHTP